MLKLNWTNIKSAVVYGLVSMAFAAVVTIAESIFSHGSIFGLDWHHLIDTGAMAALGVFVSVTSVIKNLLTDDKGRFLGAVTVIPDKKY